MASNSNQPFPSQKRPGSAKLPQPVKGPLGSVAPAPNPEEYYQPPSEGPLGEVAGGPSPEEVEQARAKASALLAQAAKLGSEDNDRLEEEASAAGVRPGDVDEALRWLSQKAHQDPKWLLGALKRLDPGTVSPASQHLSDLFAVYRNRAKLR